MIEWRCLANYQFNSEAKKIVSFDVKYSVKTHTILRGHLKSYLLTVYFLVLPP